MLKRLVPKAIAAGAIVALVAYYLLGLPLYLVFGVFYQAAGAELASILVQVIWRGIPAFIGGYVAASLAPKNEVANSLAVGLLSVVVIWSPYIASAIADPSELVGIEQDKLFQALRIIAGRGIPASVAAIALSYLAAILRMRRTAESTELDAA